MKSHGGTDDEGFAAAIELGYDMVRNRLLDRIEADLDLLPCAPARNKDRSARAGTQNDDRGIGAS